MLATGFEGFTPILNFHVGGYGEGEPLVTGRVVWKVASVFVPVCVRMCYYSRVCVRARAF